MLTTFFGIFAIAVMSFFCIGAIWCCLCRDKDEKYETHKDG